MSKRVFSLVAMLLFLGGSSLAQQARVKQYKADLAGTLVLGTAEDKYTANVFSLEMPEAEGNAEQQKLREIKKRIAEQYPRTTVAHQKKSTSSVMAPIVEISFISDSLPGIPSDNNCAVSKGNKGVAVMNSVISVHDVTTGAFLNRKSLNVFSLPLGLNGPKNGKYDPKVIYDPVADKFICVILNGTNQYNNVILGFSQTNDPAGTWNLYKFYGDYLGDTTWFDYPAISITQNEFFLTGNKLVYDSSWQAGFRQTLIYQVNKQDGYTGSATLNYRIWDSIRYNNKFVRFLHPLCPADSLPGPSQYFLSNRNFDVSNDTVFIVKVPDVIGGADSTLTVTPVVSSTIPYGVPPDGRQPDTSANLQTNDGRILGGFKSGDEIQFVSTSRNPATGNAAIYHGVIDNVSGTPTMKAQLISNDTLDFGYPNISYTGHFDPYIQSIISFDYTGPNMFPGYGAVLYNGAGYSDMVTIKSGVGSIKLGIPDPKEQRWGDYSGSQRDWNTLGAVWVEGIFGRSDHNYGNYMAKLVSPYHEAVPPVKAVVPASKLYPNPSMQYVSFDFTVANEQVFNFSIYDVQGRLVDKVIDQNCHEGKNIIQFNIAPLSSGTYVLRAAGEKGEQIAVHTFVRQ